MSQPIFKLFTDSYADELEIISFSGSEAISSLFSFVIHFKIKLENVANVDLSTITEETAYLKPVNASTRDSDEYCITGMFSGVESVFHHSNTHQYFTARLVPLIWKQTHTRSYDIYADPATQPTTTIEDVLLSELENEPNLSMNLTAPYPAKAMFCQYNESNFDFFARLTEHWGIYFFFDHYCSSDLSVFDDINYEALPLEDVKLDESTNPTQGFKSVRTLTQKFLSVPDGVVISEVNPDQADTHFQGIAGQAQGKNVVHFVDACADTLDEAEFLANIRLEELQQYKTTYHGTSGIPSIMPGYVLKVATPDGAIHEILIVEVGHNANNLDNAARSSDNHEQPYYECTFKGIPKTVQFRPALQTARPKAISTTARVYSASDDKTIAQRNEHGKYQIIFDFLKDEKKVSHWIRHASHAARTNHFDMPLVPETEVQIAFVGGNPDRPYIMNALENSQSSIHPVTHENPHHATMITDGMLYTGALKSRQELHLSSDQDVSTVQSHITNFPLKQLDKAGVHTSGENVNPITGDVHISRTYGDRYQMREGVDFNYGLNATYNFGQQYIENHAYTDTADSEIFNIESGSMLDCFDQEFSTIYNSDLQPGLNKEREAGLVQKDFGNKYFFHQGYAYNWSAGLNGNGIHKTFNFGSAYVENHTADNNASGLVNNPSSGFPSSPNENTDLITKTFGNTFELQEGNQVDVLTGDITSEHTGNTCELINGNIDSEINGDITEKITAKAKIESTTKSPMIIENIEGEQVVTIKGNIIETHNDGDCAFSRIGATTETFMGAKASATLTGEAHIASGLVTTTFLGGYNTNAAPFASENFAGVKYNFVKCAEFENGKLKQDKADVTINNYSKTVITKTNINIVSMKMTIIG